MSVRLESGEQVHASSPLHPASSTSSFSSLVEEETASMSLQRPRQLATDVDPQPRYNKLPPELWNIIIDLASLGPPSSSNSSGSFFDRDVPTMLSLNLVCLEMHDYVQPKIYQKIAITRPSALYALHQVLQAHPERARLVESIHIGPQEVLPPYWWPLSILCTPRPRLPSRRYARLDFGIPSHPRRLLSTSLDQSALPFGCEPRQAWALDRTGSSCREWAIDEALTQGQRSLGVDLLREKAPRIERVYQVQAALDLYLAHVKSIEEQKPKLIMMARPGAQVPRHTTISDVYPPLVLTDVPAATPSLRPDSRSSSLPPYGLYDKAVVLSYSQLLCHLARPGAITDRFDHPILWERSGFEIRIIEPERISPPSEEPPRFCSSGHGYELHHRRWRVQDEPDAAHWPQLPFLQAIIDHGATSEEERSLLTRVIHTGTLPAILRLARGILASATRAKTVSLTGFLQHAIDSSSQRLTSLRRLSLGPPPPGWRAKVAFQGLEQVEELRICGASLELEQGLYITNEMRRLQRLEWSLRDKASEMSFPSINIVRAIQHLVTDNVASAPAETSSSPSQAAAPGRSDNEEDSHGAHRINSSVRGIESSTPLIVARLHPTDVQAVLATAPNPENRSAWLEGRPTSNDCRRLLLEESSPADGESDLRPSQNSKSRVWGEMFEEGRRWVRGE